MSVTIIIPTYQRLAYLKIALESCLKQTLLPAAIIIGDDSKDDETEEWYKIEKDNWPVQVTYKHNKPGLGQADNVEHLIQSVKTSHLILLHDDDWLMPNAVNDLWDVMVTNPSIDVAFGKQIFVDMEGHSNMTESEKINTWFYRTKAYEGHIAPSIAVLIRQQLPSNSFLIKSDLAQDIGYGENSVAGHGVDFHFCYKLSQRGAAYYYIDNYISYYRNSADGVSKTSDSGYFAFKLISQLEVNDSELLKLKDNFLQKKAPIAIVQALNRGCKKEAWEMFISKYYRSQIFSLGGLKRMIKIIIH